MRIPRLLTAVLVLTLSAGAAHAQCHHNGEPVDEGTRVGDHVCRDGRWVIEEE